MIRSALRAIVPLAAACALAAAASAGTEDGKLLPPAGDVDGFGHALASDGVSLAVSRLDELAPVVLVFARDGSLEQRLEPPVTDHPFGIVTEGLFGFDLALEDGLLVVAGEENVYTYRRTASGWERGETLPGSASSLALQEGTLAVGRSLFGGVGRVEVYRRGATGAFELEAELLPPVGGITNFGYDVALHRSTLVVGAPTGGPGAVYAYRRAAGAPGWVLTAHLAATDSLNPAAQLGRAVAVSDDWIAVGAPAAGAWAGAVLAFRRSDPSEAEQEWTFAQELRSARPLTSDAASQDTELFGLAVAFRGSELLVGAPARDFRGVQGAGVVLRYGLDPAEAVRPWSLEEELGASDASLDLSLGFSLLVLPSGIAAGAPFHPALPGVYFFDLE